MRSSKSCPPDEDPNDRDMKRARPSHIWQVTIMNFTDDYKARGDDWSSTATELFWEKEDAEKKERELRTETIIDKLEGGWDEGWLGPKVQRPLADFLREESKKAWKSGLKWPESDKLWTKALDRVRELVSEMSLEDFSDLYEKLVKGEFVPVCERIMVEKADVK